MLTRCCAVVHDFQRRDCICGILTLEREEVIISVWNFGVVTGEFKARRMSGDDDVCFDRKRNKPDEMTGKADCE